MYVCVCKSILICYCASFGTCQLFTVTTCRVTLPLSSLVPLFALDCVCTVATLAVEIFVFIYKHTYTHTFPHGCAYIFTYVFAYVRVNFKLFTRKKYAYNFMLKTLQVTIESGRNCVN